MGAVAVIVGVFIVLVVALDMGLAVLHPTVPGPISHRVTRLIWRAIRGLAVALRTPRPLIFGGPLTTLGLGDLLPTENAMGVAVVCKAATGAGTVSAAISYILSVYPLATQTRAHARYFSDLQLADPAAAAQYLDAAGDSSLADVHQRLIDGHQSLRRFPVLYYFPPDQEAESINRLLENAAVICSSLAGRIRTL